MYVAIIGVTYALNTAVIKRGYSRNSGLTEETLIARSGKRFANSSAARVSFLGFT